MLRKATASDADVVVFDLEDAVSPDRKDTAREAVARVLEDVDVGSDGPEVCVRLNPEGVAADDDLRGVLGDPTDFPDSVMLPKVESAEDVRTVDRLLSEHDADLPVLAIVETATGVLNAPAVASNSMVEALCFGAEDLAADVGATRTPEGTEVLAARQRVVLAATAGGVDAIDTVFTDIENVAGLRADTETARNFGYDGKMAIHPAQVGPINEAFTPNLDRVEWARRVLAAHEEAAREGRGVFRVDDEMIDAPLIRQAERAIERARAGGFDVEKEDLDADDGM